MSDEDNLKRTMETLLDAIRAEMFDLASAYRSEKDRIEHYRWCVNELRRVQGSLDREKLRLH